MRETLARDEKKTYEQATHSRHFAYRQIQENGFIPGKRNTRRNDKKKKQLLSTQCESTVKFKKKTTTTN